MGSDESHFNVSLTVRDKSQKTVSIILKNYEEKKKAETRNRTAVLLLAYQPKVLLLGQTGSQTALGGALPRL